MSVNWKKTVMCINPECGNCGWEMEAKAKRCRVCGKQLVVAKTYYETKGQ